MIIAITMNFSLNGNSFLKPPIAHIVDKLCIFFCMAHFRGIFSNRAAAYTKVVKYNATLLYLSRNEVEVHIYQDAKGYCNVVLYHYRVGPHFS